MALVLTAGLAAAGHAVAQSPPLLHELLQDHAVLQRERPIALWGQSAPGATVSIALGASSASTRADARGGWRAQLPAMSAGGPYELTVRSSSGSSQAVHDLLVGDVFLCSGQSNMELSVLRSGDSRAEIANSSNNAIRMLTIGEASSATPLLHFKTPVAWQVAGPDTVAEWSAACFFFARELQKSTHAPIGLLHASWGGSNIRPWMSVAALHANGGYEPGLKILATYTTDPAAAQAQFAAQWEQWWRAHSAERAGTEPWSAHPASAAAFKPAPAGLGDWRFWGVPELQNFTGLIWYRTRFTLNAAQAAAGASLALGPINQVDETWINGHAIGNTFGYGTERSYVIPAGVLSAGANSLVVNVTSTYGGGGLLSGGTPRALHFGNGQTLALEGPWDYQPAASAIGYPPRAPWESVGGLSTLYNAMIAPIGAYPIRAAVWYQGESNTGEADSYQGLLAGLMADWRHQFGADLPFLVVQLPNYGNLSSAPQESGWAELRQAQQRAVAHDAHAGLAVTIDIGDAHNLHPTNKQDVGRRLAQAARHVIYGESIAPSGPVAQQAQRSGAQIAVEFADVDGSLIAYSHDSPIAFELCADAAGSCRYVQAALDGVRVLLTIPTGLTPTRVRYGWADSPICTLFDRSGLPAGPFELRIRQ
ncbi:MAG TPA: sialate O-acetylesterase [Steroidobacteraceae bacterium]